LNQALKPSKEPEKEKEGTREEEIEIREIKEEPEKIIIEKEEEELEEKEEEAEEVSAEETKEAIKEETEEIVISKKWIYGVAILVVVILFFFALRSCSKENQAVEETTPKLEEVKEAAAACTSDSDCKQEGKVGVCLNPNTKEAKCEFKEETGKKDAETGLIVINDEDCKLCDSSRMTNIIQEIFPNVKITGINYKTAEAKNIINQLGIDALPAYVFDSNLNSTMNFNDFKNALIKKGNKYLVTNTASGASYYFKRPLMKNKLDLYVIPETSEKIDAYTQEVVNLFADKIDFTRHIVTEGQKDELKKELGNCLSWHRKSFLSIMKDHIGTFN